MKVGIISLGCPRNLVDSEVMLGILKEKHHSIVDMDEAEVAIVNTCAFIEDAKKESIDVIFDLIHRKEEGLLKGIIVAGCLAQRYKNILKDEMNEIDVLVGTDNINLIADALDSLTSKKNFLGKTTRELKFSPRYIITPSHFVYLKISEGCLNNCSYCVIPNIRGSLRSKPIENILEELDCISKDNNISELNIVSQDTTLYGLDLYGKVRIVDLLNSIIKLDKFHWIRLLYNHPAHIKDDLLDLIKEKRQICKYIDIPIQHISDKILKAMNRQVTKKDIVSLIEDTRKKMSDVAIRTALIVGFPGETDKDFRELYNFVKETKFERLGVFEYSKEESTPAFDFKSQIPEQIKKERFEEIMLLQQGISESFNKGFLGKGIEVLIDERSDQHENVYMSRSMYDAPEVDGLVYVTSNKSLSKGDFVNVKITNFYEYDLAGEVA